MSKQKQFLLIIALAFLTSLNSAAKAQQNSDVLIFLPVALRTAEAINHPPTAAANPSPANGAGDQASDLTLSWFSNDLDGDQLFYDVYLESNNANPDQRVANDQTESSLQLSALTPDTTYYWRISVKDEHAAITEGPVWHFTTAIAPSNDFATQVVNLVNIERAQVGCSALAISPQLTAAAQGHSIDMALNDFFSHTGSNGSSPWDRIRATGYQFSTAAENIAAGYTTPQSVMAGWMGSGGHRANILNCALKDIGVGYFYLENDSGNVNYTHYWTQSFAAR